ncbi:hypothetical protein R83H12_01603 [Fibrobacteria bacterium R8-3-H12]
MGIKELRWYAGITTEVANATSQIQGLTKSEKVRIFNLRGIVLLNRYVQPNENISIANLPKGVYLMNIADKTFKFVK